MLKFVIGFWFVISTVVLIMMWPLVTRVFALSRLNRKGEKALHFRTIYRDIASREIPASTQAAPLPDSPQTLTLPKHFESGGERLDLEQFLTDTGASGMVVVHRGEVVFENYEQGMRPGDLQLSFSVTKSITSTLIGIALEEGILDSVDDPVDKYLVDLKGSGYEGVTIAQCLEMGSAIDFQEDYEDGKPSDMPAFQKHFAMNKPALTFISQLKRHADRTPGSFCGYSSMDAQVAGSCLVAALLQQEKTLSQYLYEKIWQPLGAQDKAHWLVDGAGVELTAGGLCASVRDLAKFGQLFLQQGRWGDQQIVSEEWVAMATSAHAPQLMPGKRDDCLKPWGYGYLWWIPEHPNGGDYFASGIYNQFVYVNPEAELVIAKLGANEQFADAPELSKHQYVDAFQAIVQHLSHNQPSLH